MPQIRAPKRLGVALDHDLTKTPAPVYLNTRLNNSRDYRANVPNAENMMLGQSFPNVYDDSRWHGNGMPGHVQFMPYVGREPLRPGAKLERDIQVSTLPREHGRPLNVTQMGRSKDSVKSCGMPSQDELRQHDEALTTMRNMRGLAREWERTENPHSHSRRQIDDNTQRQQRLGEQAEAIKGMRIAGLASINPRMGTCGSLPDLNTLRGSQGIDQWRTSTPWAISPDQPWHGGGQLHPN